MHSVSSRAGPFSPSIRSDLAPARARASARPFARIPVAPRDRAWSPRRPTLCSRAALRATHPTTSLLARVHTLTMTSSSSAAAAAASSSSPSASSDDALFLGLDFGTSGARAVVVDASGDVRHESVAKYPPIVDGGKGGDGIPEGGWAEAWRGALWTLLDRVPSEISSRVAAVAVDGTSGTVLMVDGATGEPVYPPMLYNEKRPDAMPAVEAMAPEGHTVRSATSALCKLHSWWTERGSDSSDSGARLLHHADWIAFLLHGEMGVTDHNNALKLGFDPAGEGSYPSWLSSAPYASTLPTRVLPPGTRAGTVASAEARSRLPEGCVVVAGTTDSVAAFVAARCTSPGDCVTSLGSSLALKMVSRTRVDDSAKGVYSHRLCGDWLVGGASNLGGWLLRSHFTDDELATLTERMDVERMDSEDVPDYFPGVLMGFGLTVEEASAALQPRPDDDVAFLRAILESIAGVEARSYAALVDMGASHPPARVFTAGGGAKNEKWSRVRSRAMGGVPVDKSPYAEAAYGAALLARMGHYELPTYVPDA